uniref:Uncharacterized protein n=1 Tax=viral metagenome TaxID=1070528 RepID=A0A6M3LS62_9ZZZZ
MKTGKVEVKADGKSIGTVEYPIYVNAAEADKDLGSEKAVSLINRQIKSDFMNEFRAAQTRVASPVHKLAKLAKTNPELEKRIAALLEKYAPQAAGAATTATPESVAK